MDDEDDEDISITDEEEEDDKKETITAKSKKIKVDVEELNDFNYSEPDDFELSDSIKKKPLKHPDFSPIKKENSTPKDIQKKVLSDKKKE